MKTSRKIFFFLIGLLAPMLVSSQTNGGKPIGDEEIDIVKPYQPLLADAVKISFEATLPEADSSTENYQYLIQPKLFSLPYTPPKLKAVAMVKEPTTPLQNQYIKIGGGTQFTRLAEISLHNGRDKESSYGALIHFLAMNGGYDYQQFDDATVNLFGKKIFKNNELSGNIDFSHRNFYFYGLAHSDSVISKNDLKQTFTGFGLNGSLAQFRKQKNGFDYRVDGSYKFFSSRNAHESNAGLSAAFSKSFYKIHSAHLDFAMQYDDMKDDSTHTAYIVSPSLYYKLTQKNFYIVAGIASSIDDGGFHIYPWFDSEKSIVGSIVIFYAGWKGWMKSNFLQEMSESNNFLANNPNLQRSRMEDRYTGIRGSYGNHFSYNLRFGQVIERNAPLFINDSSDRSKFRIVYDSKISAFNFHSELGWKSTEKFQSHLMLDYHENETESEKYAWHVPALMVTLDANYQIGKKLTLKGEIFSWSNSKAKINYNSTVTNAGTFDLNFAVAFHISSSVSAFANFNNILNKHWSRYYGYPGFGFNGVAGFSWGF